MSDGFGRGDADRNEMNAAHPPAQRPGRDQGGGPVAPDSPGPAGGTAGSWAASLDEVTAERLLRGDTVDDRVAASIARLLEAAAAPATADEMRRADAVLAAYAVRPRKRQGWLTRLVGVKLAAAVVAATAASGFAVAAGTGILPNPLHPRPAEPSPRPAASPAVSHRPSPIPSTSSAEPNIAGLCAAYEATAAGQRERKLATAGFAPLVAAAGGAEKVKNYCSPLAAPSTPRITPSHNATGKPSAHPSHPTPARKPQ
jgi:hypothetical protein